MRPPVQRLELEGIRRSVLVAVAVAVLVPIAIVAWLVFGTGGSKSPASAPASTASAKSGNSAKSANNAKARGPMAVS